MRVVALNFLRTAVGKKVIMAVTGFMLAVFVLFHLLGNLQVFSGPAKINHYGAFLRSVPSVLWLARAMFGAAALVHIFIALLLIVQSLRSRPRRYAYHRYVEAGFTSRTMAWTGPLILAYVIYHLLQLTWGTILPGFNAENIYGNIVSGLSSAFSSGIYLAAMVVLGLHIVHGFWSMLQTGGLVGRRYDLPLRKTSLVVGAAIALAYMAIPIAVLSGVFG